MTTLQKISAQLHKNNRKYASTKNIKLLEANINLFKKVKNLNSELRHADPETLFTYNKALFVIARNYIIYAYNQKEGENQETILNYLDSAKNYYKLIGNYIRKFPPFNFPEELRPQLSKSDFHLEEIKFHIARLDLFFIQQQNHDENNSALLRQRIGMLKEFKYQLENRYQDPSFKAFHVDGLLTEVNSSLQEAQQLLPRKRKRKTIRDTEDSPSQQSKSREKAAPTPRLKRLRKLKTAAENGEEKDILGELEENAISITITQQVLEKETMNSTMQVMQEDEKWASSEELEELEVGTVRSSAQTGLEVKRVVPEDVSQVASVTTSCRFFVEQPPNAHNPYQESPTPIQSAFPSFWSTSEPYFRQDTRESINALTAWQDAYFKTRDFEPATVEKAKKSLTLEKLGQIMLIAARELQTDTDSETYKDSLSNPALRMAVHLLLKSAELSPDSKNMSSWREFLTGLSERYRALLQPFIADNPRSTLETKDYLDFLKAKFVKKPPLIKTQGMSTQQIVNNIVEALAENLTERDYKAVKETLISSFEKAASAFRQDSRSESSVTI